MKNHLLVLKAYYVLLPVLGIGNMGVSEEWEPSAEELTDWRRTHGRGLCINRQMQ